MLAAVVSPVPLAVQGEDLFLVGTVMQGKDQGKNVYLNTRWVRENSKSLFDGEDYDSTLEVIRNELFRCDTIQESLNCWFEPNSITYLKMEEVSEFLEFYNLTKRKELLEVLTTENYDEHCSVAEVILLNSLDILIEMSRRDSGGN